MLNIKVRGNRSTGSVEEGFEGFLPYVWAGHFGDVKGIILIIFLFPFTLKLTYKI